MDDFVVLERDAEVGGTWWANTYPGCQCDVPSHLYSFSFALNPDWGADVRAPARDRGLPQARHRRASALRQYVATDCAVLDAAWDEDARPLER